MNRIMAHIGRQRIKRELLDLPLSSLGTSGDFRARERGVELVLACLFASVSDSSCRSCLLLVLLSAFVEFRRYIVYDGFCFSLLLEL